MQIVHVAYEKNASFPECEVVWQLKNSHVASGHITGTISVSASDFSASPGSACGADRLSPVFSKEARIFSK